jgi:hypothetical protein
MKSRHKKNDLLIVAIVLSTLISLIACNEKSEDSSKVVSIENPVTNDNIAQLQKEAQQGDPDAQYNLAYRYENGFGIAKDEAKALELYQNAADQGHSEAQISLDAMRASK